MWIVCRLAGFLLPFCSGRLKSGGNASAHRLCQRPTLRFCLCLQKYREIVEFQSKLCKGVGDDTCIYLDTENIVEKKQELCYNRQGRFTLPYFCCVHLLEVGFPRKQVVCLTTHVPCAPDSHVGLRLYFVCHFVFSRTGLPPDSSEDIPGLGSKLSCVV